MQEAIDAQQGANSPKKPLRPIGSSHTTMYRARRPDVFRTSEFPVKKIIYPAAGWQKPIRIGDVCYQHLRLDIFTGRVMGLLLFNKTSDGMYSTKYMSAPALYFLFVFVITSYLCYTTLHELFETMRNGRTAGTYVVLILLFCQLVLLVFVAEAKKINSYFCTWMTFQRHFWEKTGDILTFRCDILKTILVIAKIVFFVVVVTLLAHHFPGLTWTSRLLICYHYFLIMFLTSFWHIIIICLYKTGIALHDLAKATVMNKTRLTVADVEDIWISLYRLGKITGDTFCFTYCSFILYLFLSLIVTTYEALIIFGFPITLEKAVFLLLSVTGVVHTSSIPFTAQMATKKMGVQFYELLVDLKTKHRIHPRTCQEIDQLLQTMSDNPPVIDLGGFVTLDNGLVTSLMSTMVTYLIVLVQFKV